MKNKSKLFIFILIFTCLNMFGQTKIRIQADNEPLTTVLHLLSEQHNIKLSYSEDEISKYRVSVTGDFSNAEEAIRKLISELPLSLKIKDDVIIIIPKKRTAKDDQTYRLSGQIIDIHSLEPLPWSQIVINGRQIFTDVSGFFTFEDTQDSVFHVEISHLGYFVVDTVLASQPDYTIKLIPSIENLKEITIRNNVVARSALVGETAGHIKINHAIARLLPGQGDNSIFTLLRLMPGIQSTSEQTGDPSIWGSYEGQSLITFDEFTLFGLKNYNENINIVNPFMVKNIEIDKGGYEVKYGNRVGGLINIEGKNGNRIRPKLNLNINPTTLNGMVETPVFSRSSIMLAYRQTYYDLYNSDDFNIFAPTRPVTRQRTNDNNRNIFSPDISVFPDKYSFRDFNVKYSQNFSDKDVFYVSYYRGGDVFKLNADTELQREQQRPNGRIPTPFEISLINRESNDQQGISGFYNKQWDNGNLSKLILEYADFNQGITESIQSENLNNGNIFNKDRIEIRNFAEENSLRCENTIQLKNGAQLEFGGGFYANKTEVGNFYNYNEASSIDTVNLSENNRGYLFLQYNFFLNKKFTLKTGIRGNYVFDRNDFFAEPRIHASYYLSDHWTAQASWGIYYQFMYKMANVDRDNNYNYIWTINPENSGTLNATHWIGGINYSDDSFTLNLETYYKTTRNLTRRFYAGRTQSDLLQRFVLYEGDAKAYGLDTYIRKDFGRNTIWASYTLSKSLERLAPPRRKLPDYTAAPHDQRHEFKIAGIINLNNFYLSANYIYGSGMAILTELFEDENNIEYHRIDAALSYNFRWNTLNGEAGISILNILDHQNLVQRNVKNISIAENISPIRVYTEAVPFTPVFFVRMVF